MKHSSKLLPLLAMFLTVASNALCATSDDYDHFTPEAYANSGDAKRRKNDLDGAITQYTKAIELKPDFAQAYNSRASSRKAKGDLDGAIADYTQVIEVEPPHFVEPPRLAMPYYYRGNAKRDKGDLDGAIADYTKAGELQPRWYLTFHDRGNVKRMKGDADGAIADCTKAIELNPQYPLAYHLRGCIRYDLRANADALLDFRKEAEVGSSSDYARFRIWLTRARMGEAEAATTELQTYLAGGSTGKPEDWPSKIGHFLAGQLAEPDFLAAAKDADAKKEADQLCEANFYVASKHLLADDKTTASDYFKKSIATERKDFVEYSSAVAELKLLNAEKK